MVDFCVRPKLGAWIGPLLGGRGCPGGFSYPEVSARFLVPEGDLEIKAIRAGGDCSTVALSATGTSIAAGERRSALHVGGGAQPAELVTFRDDASHDDTTAKVRLVHAMVGARRLMFGLTRDPRPPTDLVESLLQQPLGFGTSPRAGATVAFGSVNDNGYLVLAPATYFLGAAEESTPRALLAFPARGSLFQTAFAVGDVNSTRYPPRGLLCEDGVDAAGPLGQCVTTDLPTLSVDVFAAGLFGGMGPPDEAARRPYIVEAVAHRGSDLFCLTDIARQEDRDAVIAAASGTYPFAFAPRTDLDTPPTDPTDATGAVPTSSGLPPCGPADPAKVDAALQCLVDHCATKPGDWSATVLSTDCGSTQCLGAIAPLYMGNRDERRCWDCLGVELTSYLSFTSTKRACTADPREPFGFDGQTPQLLLSRLPIRSTDTFVLPSSLGRRAVLRARVATDEGRELDFYCAELSLLAEQAAPYTGLYGNGNDAQGWANEQMLQAKKVIAWVSAQSAGRPAILAGTWNAALGVAATSSTEPLGDKNPDVIRALRAAFTEAAPRGWAPSCTQCAHGQNAYNSDSQGYWNLRTYLLNMSADATTQASTFFTDPVVALPSGTRGMLSSCFGFNVQVLRP